MESPVTNLGMLSLASEEKKRCRDASGCLPTLVLSFVFGVEERNEAEDYLSFHHLESRTHRPTGKASCWILDFEPLRLLDFRTIVREPGNDCTCRGAWPHTQCL